MRVTALDGLRGLALLGMLAWHAKLDWIQGGFARMTIFFVLSGFLATSSLERIRSRTPRGATWSFLRRRVHRLLPLTLLGVAAAMAVTVAVGSVAARRSLQGDATSVIAGFSNWRMIAESRSYGELFESPSAFQHFWSLSAEEQCIWILPLVLAIAVVVARRRTWLPVALLGAALLAIPAFVEQSPDAIYYGTPNRAGEFLAGSALALWLARRTPAPASRWVTPVRAIGSVSLGALLVIMVTVDRETPWLYRGGLALVVLPVVGVVAAIATHGGPARWALSARPLVLLGRWALSIYVLHWPLYLLMEDGRVGLTGTSLALAEIAAAIGLGALVHRTVERPLLPRPDVGAGDPAPVPRRLDRALPALLGAAAAVLVVAAVLAPVPPPTYDFAAAEARARQAPVPTTAPLADAPAATRVNLGVFGGSTGVLLGAAVYDWANEAPDVAAVPAWSQFGCGFVTDGEYVGRDPAGQTERVRPDPSCAHWEQAWAEATRSNHVQVAVVVTGVWETTDWVLDGHDGVMNIDQPEFRQLVHDRVAQVVDAVAAEGAHVVITAAPRIGPGITGTARADRGLPDNHDERVATFNAMLREIAAERTDVAVLDYDAYIDSLPLERSVAWLPDGIHPTDAAARAIWSEFLGPQIRTAIATNWPQLVPAPSLSVLDPPIEPVPSDLLPSGADGPAPAGAGVTASSPG